MPSVSSFKGGQIAANLNRPVPDLDQRFREALRRCASRMLNFVIASFDIDTAML